MPNRYVIGPAVAQVGTGAPVTLVPGALFASGGAVVSAAPAQFATAMTLAATTVASLNPGPTARSITISGGTVTVIAINGVSTGQTSGTFTVPPGGSITVTYSVAPAFTDADPAPAAGTYPFVTGVLAGYLAAYPSAQVS